MKRPIIVCLVAALASTGALATDSQLDITNKIGSIAIIGVAFGGHRAGNVEVEIRGGFVAPALRCTDRVYLTTLASADPGSQLLGLLEERRWKTGKLVVTITDDPTLQAFSGRCSLKAVGF